MRALLFGAILFAGATTQALGQSAHDVCLNVVAHMIYERHIPQSQAIDTYGRCRYLLETRPDLMAPFSTSQSGRPAPLIPGPLGEALRRAGDGMRGFSNGYMAAQQPMPQMPRTMYCNPNPLSATRGQMVCR